MKRGSTLSNCFFTCGEGAGATPLTNLSNSSLVTTVLQSAAAAAEVAAPAFPAGAVFAAVPVAAAGFGRGAQTPLTVITAAVGGTDADVSGPAAGPCGPAMPGTGPGCAAGGPPCPQANVPNRAHSSQRLRITHFLQRIGPSENRISAKHQMLAQEGVFARPVRTGEVMQSGLQNEFLRTLCGLSQRTLRLECLESRESKSL